MTARVSVSHRQARLKGIVVVIAGCLIATALTATVFTALRRARIASNERDAIATLRVLATAQWSFQNSGIVDQDSDGHGEFGWLQELGGLPDGFRVAGGGLSGVASLPAFFSPRICRSAEGNRGVALSRGYSFQIFLPTSVGRATGETVPPPVFAASEIDPQEVRYACYAWPQAIGRTGNRAFVLSQRSEVFATDNVGAQNYSGTPSLSLPFSPGAAFVAASSEDADNLEGQFVPGIRAWDGHPWYPAEPPGE